ncbi:hypothetical protein ACROYT_G015819 [Oculina patagonica]
MHVSYYQRNTIVLLFFPFNKRPTSNRQRQPVKDGNPSDDELEKLSRKLGDKWEELGRRLGIDQSELTAFERENMRLFDKAHRMLMSWRQREGSAATYQDLPVSVL